MITEKCSMSLTSSGGSPLSGSCTESGSSEILIDEVFQAGSSNVLLSISFPHATLQSLFLVSDQALTIKTNSSSAPANTYNLVAGRPFRWGVSDGYYTNPVSADVTAFYITCTATARLQGKILNQ